MVINLNFSYDKNVTKYYKSNKNLLKGPMDFYISPKYIKK